MFFGTDTQRERAAVIHRARFHFMSEALWGTQAIPSSDSFRATARIIVLMGDCEGAHDGQSAIAWNKILHEATVPVYRGGAQVLVCAERDGTARAARNFGDDAARICRPAGARLSTVRLAGISSGLPRGFEMRQYPGTGPAVRAKCERAAGIA